MALVERFEDLIAWQRARELSKAIYQVSGMGPFAKDFGLKGQIRDAGTSTMGNIAEGFERGSRREFRQFLVIARGSCGELRSHFYAAFDAGHIDEKTFEYLRALSEEVSRIIGGLRDSLVRPRPPRPTDS